MPRTQINAPMTQEVKLRRSQCNYRPENARFLLECDFSKQYSHYYRRRLEKTKPFLEFNCRSKWDPSIPLYGLAELASVMSLDLDYVEKGLPPSMSPDSPESIKSRHMFPKRMRKLSEDSRNSSQYPTTSTQNKQVPNEKAERENLFESPIFPPRNKQTPLSSETLNANAEERRDEQPPDCIIIGTIFKRMKLQPDVIEELSKGDYHIKHERYLGHYTSPNDSLVLEDADESISVIGNINPKRFVTGVVVALLGVPINDGSQFYVRDICYAEPNRLILYSDISSQVVSGLGFHPDMGKTSMLTRALQNMIDFVWGGANYSDDERSSQVTRILVLGDSLLDDRLALDEDSSSQKDDLVLRMKQSRQVKQYSGSIQAIKHMDDFFAQISKTINVDVMPGPSDPSSHLMPQQPFHPCMFPKSCMFPTFNCTTNPHHAIYKDDVEILATAGQNIDIVSKFSGLEEPIEIMRCHLMWGNSAPSAPDNLYSVPYEDDDPFVIDFIPDIYLAGCQESYRRDYYDYTSSNLISGDVDERAVNHSSPNLGTNRISEPSTSSSSQLSDRQNLEPACSSRGREEAKNNDCSSNNDLPRKSRTILITIPKFYETLSCVLINLNNLESQLVSFK